MMNGRIEWIGIRPQRKADVVPVKSVNVSLESGLDGDHDTKPHRQVTLISQEALQSIATQLKVDEIDPAATRRNIAISGLDFTSMLGKRVQLGSATLEITGECHPCSRMEENLGEGGRLAMANQGGLTARVISGGIVAIGDDVVVKPNQVQASTTNKE